MCNPRKVMIHLARHIEQAFRRAVERSAAASGTVEELATINVDIRLNEEMGDAALRMLERVLAGEFAEVEAWTPDDRGRWCREVEHVTLMFDPATSQLTLETRLTRNLTAEGVGVAEACGFTVGDVAVEAIGRYYDDNWGGRTRELAAAEAQAAAEAKMAKAIEELHELRHAEALGKADAEARAAADANAAANMDRLRSQARSALREQLTANLARAEERVFHIMNRAVGEAYRQTLRQTVLENGGRIINDQKTGSIITMELEL